MYDCDICQKSYASEKRYLSHVERCQNRESKRSNKSTRSVRSAYSISDVESDTESISRSRHTNRDSLLSLNTFNVEKFLREKAKLKKEIKKYSNEMKNMLETHRYQLEQNEEYYQEQINTLAEERDQLSDQVVKAQEQLFQEKEKLRSNFINKLSKEKNAVEKRYAERNSGQLSRLTSTVEQLQQQLSREVEDKESLRDVLEQKLANTKDYFCRESDAKNEQIEQLKKTIKFEQEQMVRLQQSLESDKESFKRFSETEKEREIQTLKMTHLSTVKVLENTKSMVENELKDVVKQSYDTLEKLKNTHHEELRCKDIQLSKLKNIHSKNLEDQHRSLSVKITDAEKMLKEYKKKKDKETESKVQSIENKTDKIISSVKQDCSNRIRELNEQLEIQKQEIVRCKRVLDESITKKEKEMNDIHKVQIEELERDIRKINETNKKELNNAISERDQSIEKLKQHNSTLSVEINKIRDIMMQMRDDTGRIKRQYLESLNKQKEEKDRIIMEHEINITNLNRELRKLSIDCEAKINKNKNIVEEVEKEKSELLETLKIKEEFIKKLELECEKNKFIQSSIHKEYEQRIKYIKEDLELF